MANIGFRIYADFKRPSPELVEKFRDFATSNVSDNMNRFGCLDWRIKPVNKAGDVRLLGTAFTAKTRGADNLLVHKAIDMAAPGDVIVIDAQGDTSNAILGEIMCRYAATRGIRGFIVNGMIRDKAALSLMDNFVVYALGAVPKGPYKDGPGEINVPIACGSDVIVNPGDIIVGDEDGVVVIRPDEAEELFAKTKATMAKEAEIFKQIEAGKYDRAWVDATLSAKGCEIIAKQNK